MSRSPLTLNGTKLPGMLDPRSPSMRPQSSHDLKRNAGDLAVEPCRLGEIFRTLIRRVPKINARQREHPLHLVRKYHTRFAGRRSSWRTQETKIESRGGGATQRFCVTTFGVLRRTGSGDPEPRSPRFRHDTLLSPTATALALWIINDPEG